jgi:protein phosphatase
VQVIDIAAWTDGGPKRPLNEDAALGLAELGLVAVADGMGGSGGGDVAAAIAMDFLRAASPVLAEEKERVRGDGSSEARLRLGRLLERCLLSVHDEVAEAARDAHRKDMAVTLVCALIADGHAHIAHVGECRAYLVRDNRIRLLTDDHTVAMVRLRQGRMTEDELRQSPLRHQLYQALGAGNEIDVDTAEVALADEDVLLLCTDGVYGVLDEGQLLGLVRRGGMQQAAARLVDAAVKAGSDDNLGVALVKVGSSRQSAMLETIAEVLRNVFLFRDLSESERMLIAPYLDQRSLKAGEPLFREGDPGDAFFVVLDGGIRIHKGETHLIDVAPGGHLGELSLARPTARSASATALRDSLVFGLSRDRFHELIRRRPALGARLSLTVLDYVGDRLREMTDRVENVEKLVKGELRPEGLSPRDALLAAARGKLKR